ncbi:MAG: PH domain-containing protein [Streptosporangiaceae bacterium]
MGTVPVGREKRAEATGGPQVFRSPTAVIIWWVWLLFAVGNLVDLAVQGRDRLSLVAAAILLLVTGIAYVTAQRPRVIADTAGITIVNPLRDHHIGWAGVTKVDLADLLRVHCRRPPDDTKVIYSWAVHYSRRRKAAAEVKARRTAARMGSGRSSFGTFGLSGGGFGMGPGYGRSARRDLGYGSTAGGESASAAEAEAERIVRVLSEYATAARAEAVWAEGTVEIAGAGPATGNEPAGNEPAGHLEPTADGPADLRVTGWLEPLKSTWNRTALLALLIPALIVLVIAVV